MKDKALEGLRVILVDDDKVMLDSLAHLLSKAGWQIKALNNGREVEQVMRNFPADVILSDVRMPGMNGLELLRSLTMQNSPPIVLISAHGDIPTAVEAMQSGAYSFLEKPFDPHRLMTVLRNAAERHRLTLDTARLKARLADLSGLDRVLIGESAGIKELQEEVLNLSRSEATVMLLGDTGTGKELVAHALHDLSPRAAGPFIDVNCATIPSQGFEERIFGIAEQALGLLARANGGTLFLDELGACPLDVQAKLLRVMETREFAPMNGTNSQRVDVRIVSASNEQLDVAIAEGRFREDLFYRLNTVILTLPPLRERRGDIPLLYEHFTSQYAELYEVIVPDVTSEDLAVLMSHDWPGNVRELRHVAERRILAARRGRGSVREAIMHDNDFEDVPETLREAVAAFERQLIAKAVRTHQGRMDAIAEALGIGRRTLNEKIVKLGLNKADLL